MRMKEETQVVYHDLKQPSKLDADSLDQIDKDINRTFFPAYHRAKQLEDQEKRSEAEELEILKCMEENESLRKQTRNVLIAYNVRDPKIGYVQGFNSIVAALLYIFHQAKEESIKKQEIPALDCKLELSEEEVFYTFYGLMTLLSWRERFLDGMSDIGRMCQDFSLRMKKEDPNLYKKFFKNQVNKVERRFHQ